MDKREHLAATLAGEKTDRLSCGFWHHFPKQQMVGNASVQAHLDFFNAVDADMLKVMNEYPYVIGKPISEPQDWKSVKPQSFSETQYHAYLEEFKAIKKALPSEVPLFATVHGVLVSAYHATQKPGFFSDPNNLVSRHLRENPEAVAQGLQAITDTLIGLCEQLVAAGADGIYYAALGGESYRFTAEIFETYVKEFDKQVIEAVNGLGAHSILHICKDKVRIPLYRDIPASIVNWAVHECEYDLEQGREIFPEATLLGGFDDRSGVLVEGTVTEIEQALDGIVHAAGRRRLIIGADCTLPEDVALWRLQAARNRAVLL